MRKLTREEEKTFSAVRARLLGGGGPASKGYYASAAFTVSPVAAEGLGTWACDKNWRLYVDPANLPGGEAGWDVAQCAEIFEHELNHLLRAHAERMDIHCGSMKNPQQANIATDLEINDDFPATGFLASIGVTPTKFGLENNKTAEWYFDNLPTAEQSPEDGDDDKQSGDGDGNGGATDGGSASPNCGSGSGGSPVEGELSEESDIAPAISGGKAEITRKSVAQSVKEHEQQHGRGTAPGGLSEWANIQLAPPTVPWQKVLAAEVRRGIRYVAGHQDYTYTRMSRRSSAAPGVALPAMHSPKPRIAVVVDTSGSMSMEMIHEALNEVRGIAAAAGCTGDDLTLIQVDSDVADVRPFTDARKVKVNGRGGTDMRVGVEAATKMKNRPSIIIVLTDGYTPWPTQRPNKTALVAGIIGDSNSGSVLENTRAAMPWARVVGVGGKR